MLEIQYEEKTIQNAFFCLGKKVYFWDSTVNIRIHLPKFFLPEIKRQILALIKTERKIFWDPWKNEILRAKNMVKMLILQVQKNIF